MTAHGDADGVTITLPFIEDWVTAIVTEDGIELRLLDPMPGSLAADLEEALEVMRAAQDARTKARFLCVDCGESTSDLDEYYMVHDEVWRAAGMGPKDGDGMLSSAASRSGSAVAWSPLISPARRLTTTGTRATGCLIVSPTSRSRCRCRSLASSPSMRCSTRRLSRDAGANPKSA